jgi:triosephosphate isomerase
MVDTPIIIVNYKTYQKGFGKEALQLTKTLEMAAKMSGVSIAAAVSPLDIRTISGESSIPIFAQHMDPIGFGSNTGFILPEAVLEAGASGTLINHSEHRMKLADIEENVKKCADLGLLSCVCTNNLLTSTAAALLSPDFVAIEPPELIGGDISVSKAEPDLVSNTVEAIKAQAPHVSVLCGAGVKSGEDVKAAIDLGAEGVLLASGVVKADDVESVIKDLISGLK